MTDENVLKVSAKSFEQFKEDSLEKMEKFESGEDVSHSISFEESGRFRNFVSKILREVNR